MPFDVCKRRSIGFHFHHIDENSSNTIDENLAVLCVEDHDRHHRMREYESRGRHLELDAKEILRQKESWEAFLIEANRSEPRVIATLSAYGTEELIHSLQLMMQWPDERVEYKRSFHLLDGDLDRLTDEVFEEFAGIGPNVKLVLINEPLPVEHCPGCRTAFSGTLKPPVVTRLTDAAWTTESACGIYINPDQPSLGITLSFREEQILSGGLHLASVSFLTIRVKVLMNVFPLGLSQVFERRPLVSSTRFYVNGLPVKCLSERATRMSRK